MSEKIRFGIPVHVNQALSALLQIEEWPELQLPLMNKIMIDEADITSIFDNIEFESTSIMISTFLSQENHEKFDEYDKLPIGHRCGTAISGIAGDFVINASQPSKTGNGSSLEFDGKGGAIRKANCRFHAINWEVYSENNKAQTWACEIDKPAAFRPFGNLRFQLNLEVLWGYFFQGVYDYYLLPRQQRVFMLIVPQEGVEFDREKFALDIMALSFVFGEQINVSSITGFGTECTPVAKIGGLVKSPTEPGWTTEPIPTVLTDDGETFAVEEVWIAPLFKRVSETVHNRPSVRLDYALDAYLDSIKPHVIASYLRLQVILESFSYWILKERNLAREGLVKDSNEWEKWVKKELKEKIHSLALDDYKDDLYLGIKGAYKHISGRRVQDAFQLFQLGWTETMKAEIKLRNDVVHMMEMSKRKDGKIDSADLLPRLRLLQVMLIALIARVVGYGGTIRFWKSGPHKENGWWRLDDDQKKEALHLFTNSVQP